MNKVNTERCSIVFIRCLKSPFWHLAVSPMPEWPTVREGCALVT